VGGTRGRIQLNDSTQQYSEPVRFKEDNSVGVELHLENENNKLNENQSMNEH